MPIVKCPPATSIYLEPSHYTFDSSVVSIGHKFNITVKADEVADLVAWEVRMYFNDSIINVTRWFEPTWDSEYVFYNATTFGAPIQPDCAYYHVGPDNGSLQVAAILLPLPPVQSSFSGSGMLCILEFTITAVPSEEETLSCLLNINNPDTFLLFSNGSIVPNVTEENGYYALHPPAPPNMYTLTITATSGGTTDPLPGESSYLDGTQVQVSAIPDANNLFDHWELDGGNAGTTNPIEVTMDSNHTLHASFTLLTYDLTLSATAGGTTDPTPGTYTHTNGTVESVTATPNINHKFEYWVLDAANAGSDNPIDILMDSDHDLQAVFTELSYQLTIAVSTDGTTDPEPGNYTYVNGTVVSVTAIPDANYVFDHWELDETNIGTNNPTDVLMDANHTLLAVFTSYTYTLTITATAGGSTDPTLGSYNYSAGSSATVVANPNSNYLFDYWLLDEEETNENPITVQMDANHTLHAVFTLLTYELTITVTQGGTTNPSPGTYTYTNGTTVSVTSISFTGYEFVYWELDGINVGSDNPYEILVDSNSSLHAVFDPTRYYLTINAVERPSGTTDPSAGTYEHFADTSLSVIASPDSGFSFDYWLLDGEKRSENPIAIVMDMNHTLTPCFVDDIPPEIGNPLQRPPNDVMTYQNVTVTANVTDLGTGIHNVTLWYSINGGTTWTPLDMSEISANTYEATIPGCGNCTWVSYRITAYDNNGNSAAKGDYGYYCLREHAYAARSNRSIVFLVGALVIIFAGAFLIFLNATRVLIDEN